MRLNYVIVSALLLKMAVFAQDSVDVTFYYDAPAGAVNVYLPGEFYDGADRWALNNNTRMTIDSESGIWSKTVRLRVGGPNPLPNPGKSIPGAYQYKFHYDGTWLPDPLNPRENSLDEGNSYLYIKKPTIHYLLPNSRSGVIIANSVEISSYIFPSTSSSIDTNSLSLLINDNEITGLGQYYDPETHKLSYTFSKPLENGTYNLVLTASELSGAQNSDSSTFTKQLVTVVDEPRPEGIIEGLNIIDESTVIFCLLVPKKDFVHVIGDFNDWTITDEYLMKRDSVDALHIYWWAEVTGLDPNTEYAFQYLVDGQLRIADPYSEKILDEGNDPFIDEQTYPNLKAYPSNKTSHAVTAFQINEPEYQWQVTAFQRPSKEKLVIYELLIRDFVAAHNYQTLIDTLAYLANLGINAIELMPVNEFDGNESWGYNPAFHLALDKYYGTKNAFKAFIDSAHARGIAVILDVVYNHATGQSPFVRLFNVGDYGPPTADNPWLNVSATHDFSVFNDFNHESLLTQRFLDRANAYWLEEYNIDGYRFDLSKGFMQTGSFYDYNGSRVAILKRMANELWKVDSTAYIILEHLGENNEERELANDGMLLWGKMTDPYNEATMGYHDNNKSDLSWGYFGSRSWSVPHLVTYMESHDEERLMYKNISFGNSSGDYNIKEVATGLERVKAAAAFFFTIPGPKMFWQFGELGYDVSINQKEKDGPIDDKYRTASKPILWEYFQDINRNKLYKTYAALVKMRNKYDVFNNPETEVKLSVKNSMKRINLLGTDSVAVIGNFGVTQNSINPNFATTGKWYDFFSGDSIIVTNISDPITLAAGEFNIYSRQKMESPAENPVTALDEIKSKKLLDYKLNQNFPNPFNPTTSINYQLAKAGDVEITIFDIQGRAVKKLLNAYQSPGNYSIKFDAADLSSGLYFYTFKAGSFIKTRKMLFVK